MSEKLLAYIHANYMMDISLNDMATHFNLSQNYISSLFKNVTKYNFKDYLNSFRVKMAIKLLEENKGLKLIELAELVGFNNVVTLLRLFNKYEGITPGQYLKERINSKNDNDSNLF
jgi:YesN/AraC family two-component response regulator